MLVYIIIPFSLFVKIPFLNTTSTYDPYVILGIFALIWSNDVFAYLIGKNFGKHKLIERVSPNKTIEGFIGGFVFTYITGYFISNYCDSLLSYQWLAIAIIVSVFGVLGDLIESMFKRQAGVKDSSNLIPGHGGFLDRLDSVIFATPFIFVYLYLLSLKIIKKDGLPLKTDWRLIWLKNKKLSPLAKAYLEFIKTEKKIILEKHFNWYETFKI